MIISNRDMRFFHAAKKEAAQSDFKNIHVGCVVVYKNKIIATGKNMNKTSPIQKHYDYTRKSHGDWPLNKQHAEINALSSIWDADINWRNAKVYTYRERIVVPFGMSRPCAACMAAIKEKGIREIYYTTNDGFAKEVILN